MLGFARKCKGKKLSENFGFRENFRVLGNFRENFPFRAKFCENFRFRKKNFAKMRNENLLCKPYLKPILQLKKGILSTLSLPPPSYTHLIVPGNTRPHTYIHPLYRGCKIANTSDFVRKFESL